MVQKRSNMEHFKTNIVSKHIQDNVSKLSLIFNNIWTNYEDYTYYPAIVCPNMDYDCYIWDLINYFIFKIKSSYPSCRFLPMKITFKSKSRYKRRYLSNFWFFVVCFGSNLSSPSLKSSETALSSITRRALPGCWWGRFH